jgi:cephalosporin hydroxylase
LRDQHRDGRTSWIYQTGKRIEHTYKRQIYRFRRALLPWSIPYRPERRKWGSELPLAALQSIQVGALQYTYRGIPMLKNPFEVALYQLLLWRLKPCTVIEIGSYLGGSALWYADMMSAFQTGGTVISIDIRRPSPPYKRDDVRFLEGDANDLAAVLTPAALAEIARPLLVIEDSDHRPETSLAVLNFFAPVLLSGEYVVIEDALVSDLGIAHRFGGGPGLAISQFLAGHPEFAIDTSLCDWYGHNFTGNPNGYLTRR